MLVSGSDFWYYHTWNPAIIAILDRKLFWIYWSSNIYIIVIGNWINSSLHSHTLHLNLNGNTIITRRVSVELCDRCMCDDVLWVTFLFTTFLLFWSSYLFLRLRQYWIIYIKPGLFLILLHSSLKKNLVVSNISTPLHDLVLSNLSSLTCDTFRLLRWRGPSQYAPFDLTY